MHVADRPRRREDRARGPKPGVGAPEVRADDVEEAAAHALGHGRHATHPRRQPVVCGHDGAVGPVDDAQARDDGSRAAARRLAPGASLREVDRQQARAAHGGIGVGDQIRTVQRGRRRRGDGHAAGRRTRGSRKGEPELGRGGEATPHPGIVAGSRQREVDREPELWQPWAHVLRAWPSWVRPAQSVARCSGSSSSGRFPPRRSSRSPASEAPVRSWPIAGGEVTVEELDPGVLRGRADRALQRRRERVARVRAHRRSGWRGRHRQLERVAHGLPRSRSSCPR